METRQWHYVIEGKQVGPVPETELVQMLASGQIAPKTLVWTDTFENWVEASTVDELVRPNPVMDPVSLYVRAEVASETEGADENFVEVTYAGFWRRFAACLIDSAIMTMAGIFVGVIFGVIYGVSFRTDDGAGVVGNIVGTVMQWLYFALMESSANQATVGKMALGIKVTDLDGNRISFARATGRHFGKIVSALTLFIGYLMIAFTSRKQGLHDIMAGCLVVNR